MNPLLQDQSLCKIRTITTFITLSPDQTSWQASIEQAATVCTQLTRALQLQGYRVQTNRIVTNPFGEYLDTRTLESARSGLASLRDLLQSLDASDIRIRFAIGEARNLHEIALAPELIQGFGDLSNICVNVGLDEQGILDNELILGASAAVREISQTTVRGEGNFNFTVNFNCPPLIPYFPASYHATELGNRYVIGLETPDLLLAVLNQYNQQTSAHQHNPRFHDYYRIMQQALQHHISAIAQIVQQNDPQGFAFSGFDSSAAPSKDCASMADIYQAMGVEYFGASGTIEASALLTRVFKSIEGVELVGFSGLMLALTEDRGLAKGAIQGDYDIRSLLTYSAVCGIGLDTVPIPGDTSIEKIAALMRDTGALAFRLNKPLTVRVFPVPGLQAGDITAFESDDLCNCAVLAVP